MWGLYLSKFIRPHHAYCEAFLQFCMVRNLLLTFHFWLCLGLVCTCLVLSWHSLRAKIALLCFQIFTGKAHSPHPESLFVKLNVGNSQLTQLRWFCVHFVSLVALPCTVLSVFPEQGRWELYIGFSLKSLLCLIFHGNDFSEIQWDCESLFHGQSHQHLSSGWLMPPCPSLFLSFPADELLPDSRKSFF